MNTSVRAHRRNTNNGAPVDVFSNLQPLTSSNAMAPTSHKRGRRKSRSPGGQSVRSHEALNAVSKHRKKSTTTLPSNIDDMGIDRGRKSKSKSSTIATQSRLATENTNLPPRPSKKEKDRSKSRESHRRHALPPSESTNKGNDTDSPVDRSHVVFLPPSEYARMESEIENLKKQVHDNKKTIKKHQKEIASLRREEMNTVEVLKEKDAQIAKLRSKSKKNEEVISTVEANMSCQVCMEVLFKPQALSPCGHILCLTCLRQWFRSAPADEDDMVDDESPDYLLDRRKICPCCRTVVRHRPIPVFLVKSIATALAKVHKGPRRASPPPEEDVWAGLFYPDDYTYDLDDEEDVEEDDEADDEDDERVIVVSGPDEIFSYDEDDDDAYDGPYVPAHWEPPSIVLEQDDYYQDLTATQFALLRRGATLSMIAAYDMRYTHEDGISAYLDDDSLIHLGWNIRLSADDENGERYMNWVHSDVFDRRERWDVIVDDDDMLDGTFEARRLIKADEEVEYTDTDSDDYD